MDVDILGGDITPNYEDSLLFLWLIGSVVKMGENIDSTLYQEDRRMSHTYHLLCGAIL